eukprot:g19224.t1
MSLLGPPVAEGEDANDIERLFAGEWLPDEEILGPENSAQAIAARRAAVPGGADAPPAAVAEEELPPVDAVEDRPEFVRRPLRARNTAAPGAAAYCRNVRKIVRLEEKLYKDWRAGFITISDESAAVDLYQHF